VRNATRYDRLTFLIAAGHIMRTTQGYWLSEPA
jgi:hypothetical protein